jgi:hypothetical protein
MTKGMLVALVLLLPAVVGVIPASAVTVDDNLPNNLYVSGITGGQFDISLLLPGNQVTSASVTFNFADDDGYVYTGDSFSPGCGGNCYYPYGQPPGSYTPPFSLYQYGSSSGNADYWYRSAWHNYFNPSESAAASVEGQTATGGTTFQSSSFYTGQSSDSYYFFCNQFGCFYDYFSTYHYNFFSGYPGGFTLQFPLGPAQLASLGDGTLGFTVTPGGDLYLSSAVLDVELAPLAAAVPEPGTLSLLGLGLAGAILRRPLARIRR